MEEEISTEATMTGIGAMLTEARQARGLTIEQAERDTRIVRRYLVALEGEDFAAFPAEVYARGFLRSYAGYLGLNPADLLALMPRESPPEVLAPPRRGGVARDAVRWRLTSRTLTTVPAWLRSPLVQLGAYIALGLLAALVISRIASGGGSPVAVRAPGGISPPAAPASRSRAAAGVAGRMPDLRGTDADAALARLQALGITPFVIEIPSRDAPAGQVVRQSPGPNAEVGSNTVTIVVSRGG